MGAQGILTLNLVLKGCLVIATILPTRGYDFSGILIGECSTRVKVDKVYE